MKVTVKQPHLPSCYHIRLCKDYKREGNKMGHAVKVKKKPLCQNQSADAQSVAKMAGLEDPELNSSYGHTRITSI